MYSARERKVRPRRLRDMRPHTLVLLAVLYAGLAACAGGSGAVSGEPPDGDPVIVGTITSSTPFQAVTEDCVDPEGADADALVSSDDPPFCTRPDEDRVGWVSVEEDPTSETGDPKMVVGVNSGTAILLQTAEGYEPATFADLREGNLVAVWASGPIAESYPTQGDGDAIAILHRDSG